MAIKETLNEGLKRGYTITVPAADLEAVVMRCLAKKPYERFDDAEALRDELLACESAPRWDHAAAERCDEQHEASRRHQVAG